MEKMLNGNRIHDIYGIQKAFHNKQVVSMKQTDYNSCYLNSMLQKYDSFRK